MVKGLSKSLGYVAILALCSNMAHVVTPKLIVLRDWPDYIFGVLFAFMSLATLLFSPIWGKISDHYGRKIPLIAGPLIYALGQIGFMFIANEWLVCLCRFFSGIGTAALFSTVYTNLADWCDQTNSMRTLSMAMSMFAFLTNLGYLFAGIVGDIDFVYTFYLQVFLMMVLMVYAVFVLEPSPQQRRSGVIKPNQLVDFKGYARILMSSAAVLFGLYFLEFFAWKTYMSSISYFLSTVLDLNPSLIGFYMAAVGLVGLLLNYTIIRYLTAKLSKFWMLVSGIGACLGFMMLSLLLKDQVNLSLVLMMLYAAIRVAVPPIFTALVLLRAKKSDHGVYLGLLNTMEGVAGVIGSLVAGMVFSISAILPFVICLGALGLLGGLVLNFKNKIEA